MRSFVNLSKSETLHLNNQFPEILDLVNLEQVDGYSHYSISVFDHWLSSEEAKTEIDQISSSSEESHNLNLYEFIVKLSGKTTTYLVKRIGKRKSNLTFRKFLSNAGIEKTLRLKHHLVSDSYRFILLFPELETIYFEGCDFTHHFYSKKNSKNDLIETLVKINKLHILK